MSNKGPSEHTTWKEFACKDGTSYPQKFIDNGTAERLAYVFERIREVCHNQPIIIYSAYRTPTYNQKVGGAKNSQHIHGRALDLHHTKMANAAFHRIIVKMAERLGIRGIGLYKNFVHIDIRHSDNIIAWSKYDVNPPDAT